jgi:hypothetical protein
MVSVGCAEDFIDAAQAERPYTVFVLGTVA